MSDTSAVHEEQTLWSGTVSNWHYAGKWLFIFLLFAALAGSFAFKVGGDPSVVWIARGVLTVLAVITLVWIYLDRSSRRYMITNKRVSVEFGIISKNSTEMRIQDIRSINLTTKGITGLLGIGRLEFSSAATDDADVIFWNTPGAEKLRDMVRSLQV